jgi:hypothetical protein
MVLTMHFFICKGDITMPDYEKLYHKLFNEITATIENLQKVQQDAEEMYLDMCEEEFPEGEDLEEESYNN